MKIKKETYTQIKYSSSSYYFMFAHRSTQID